MAGIAGVGLSYSLWYTVIMAKIPMFGKYGLGKFATVDDEDVVKVAGIRWHVNDSGYAVNRSNGKTFRMHRLINKTPTGLFTDHKNHNRLDNRKSNLRTVTQAENMANYKVKKGYCWSKEKQVWLVRYKGKHYSCAKTEKEAVEQYKLAKSGIPKISKIHPRRKLLPKGVYYMQPAAQRGAKPYYIRPQKNGVKYFKGYFMTMQEAKTAYNNFLAKGD